MIPKTVIRSALFGLAAALIATGCSPDTLAAPQSQITPAAAAVVPVAAGLKGPPPHTASSLAGPADKPGHRQPGIVRKHPLAHDITITQMVGVRGGTIKIGQAGLTVVFSPGALLTNTPITVTADSGSLISYEFGPHGTQFHAPVAIEQDMKQTTVDKKVGQADDLYGGYMPNGTSDIVGDSATVTEMHKAETTIGVDRKGKPQMKSSVFIVWHFSGYILISTRR